MTPITNVNQLNQLMSSTMIYAVVVSLIALAIAWVITSYMIPWEGGNDRSYIKRRIVYIVVGLLAVLGFWLYNDLEVMGYIKNSGLKNMFAACNLKCVGINLGIYLVAGVALMFTFRRSKFGSILGKEKK